jgi:hypothetical protein
MSDLTTQIANVEMLLAFLKNQLPKEEVVEKPKKEVKKKDVDTTSKKDAKKEEPTEKKKKNMPQLNPAMKTQLSNALKARDIELTEPLRKEFIEYINGIDASVYGKNPKVEYYVELFAKSKGKPEEKKEDLPAKVGGSPFAGQDDPPDLNKLSNAHGYDLSKLQKSCSSEQIAEFKKTEILKPLGDGNYWHAKSGMWYFEDGDEELDEVPFDGNTYLVNKISKRVYRTTDDKDLFVGFLGIGPFKKMKV